MGQLTNELLQRLPRVYRNALLASMEEVSLPVSNVLFEPGRVPVYANFVLSGAISVIDSFQSGDGLRSSPWDVRGWLKRRTCWAGQILLRKQWSRLRAASSVAA